MNAVKMQWQDNSTGVVSEYVFEAHSAERAAHIVSESMKIPHENFTLVGLDVA